jgi:DNA-binding MarR family transcriptional regulator/ribosomal protein S18 acetylase RimI-like enzyme
MASTQQVAAVRSFNRFYTRRLGLVRGGLVRTRHPLAEARVLYELGMHQDALETSELRAALDVDAGQLSRLLARLEAEGVLTRETSRDDARRRRVCLTPAGAEAFATLDRRTVEQIGELLDGLGDERRERLIDALASVRDALGDARAPTVTVRGLEPGDLGWIVSRHGALYAREYGWDASFERLVASIMGELDPARDAGWIAELDGRRAGCVLCVGKDERTAALRTLLVEPDARGLGLGARLVDEVVRHARARGYAELTLWTNDVLTAARRVYERAGFTLMHEAPHRAFGQDLVEQTWSLTL